MQALLVFQSCAPRCRFTVFIRSCCRQPSECSQYTTWRRTYMWTGPTAVPQCKASTRL